MFLDERKKTLLKVGRRNTRQHYHVEWKEDIVAYYWPSQWKIKLERKIQFTRKSVLHAIGRKEDAPREGNKPKRSQDTKTSTLIVRW